MKKIIFVFLSTITAFISNAQDCNGIKEKIDKITGKSIRSFTVSNFTKAFTILRNGDNFEIQLSFVTAGQANQVINKGDSLLMRLQNGKLVYANAREKAVPVSTVSGGYKNSASVQSTYAIFYKISRVQMEELAKSPASAFRMYYGDNYVDFDFNDRKFERIMNAAKCLVQNQ